uniref:Ionotropic glutamate receptor L-glutamate and glycine-binding domain-containing protein n=1 Tax=Anopheles atroparvus TaxID=41427 RepID=A0A182IST7_ANOAO
MTSYGKGGSAVLYHAVLLHMIVSTRCNLQTLVEAVASFDNSSDQSGTELCIFTTENSTLEEAAPKLLQRLVGSYPTVFLNRKMFVDTRFYRVATMVLVDVTAFEDHFPASFLGLLLANHPCYRKKAKFVILVSRSAFSDRERVSALMAKFGILNFITVPLEQGAPGSLRVWTKNQFTKRELYFRSDDRPVARLFPNKLLDLYGYRFTMFGFTEFPYLVGYLDDNTYGVLVNFIDFIIKKLHNGTTHYTEDEHLLSVMDSQFNVATDRRSFLHQLYLREPSGIHLMCPVHQERDFLQHLLKPFSMGIWLVLGGLFVVCRVLQGLCPTVYRYDLIGITFFGGGGIEYEQPFPFRVVTFTLTVLIFFLSEAYNTKLISLMSLTKFYVQPQTLEEVARSDFRVLASAHLPANLEYLNLKFLSHVQTRREERRLGGGVNEVYCSLMTVGAGRLLTASRLTGFTVMLYIVEEPLINDRFVLQLHQNSPFFDLIENYFNRYNDFGIWQRLIDRHMTMLRKRWDEDMHDTFQEVVFFFNDLACVWMLIVAGWLISFAVFTGELIWSKVKHKARH